MKNADKIKIIQFHNNQLGFDCPCVLRASGKLEIHDKSRMPKDDAELERWEIEYDNHIDLGPQKTECAKCLRETDYMLLSDFEYQTDLPEVKKLRLKWKSILKSDKIQEIPKNLFITE